MREERQKDPNKEKRVNSTRKNAKAAILNSKRPVSVETVMAWAENKVVLRGAVIREVRVIIKNSFKKKKEEL